MRFVFLMPILSQPPHRRRKVVFRPRSRFAMAGDEENAGTASDRLDDLLERNKSRIEELSSTSEDEEVSDVDGDVMSGQHIHGWLGAKVPKSAPTIFLHAPLLHDELVTGTSEAQDKVMQACMELMSGKEQEIQDFNSHGIPKLQRQKHIKFLQRVLGKYPHQYQGMDASRPWLVYWALAGLSILGEEVLQYRERTIQTFAPMQNATGGFGGGHGQTSHCAASYAATLSLAMVNGLHIINRKTMWQWLGTVKQANGGFTMAYEGEEDVRGAYCAMTIVSLLNLPHALPAHCPARAAGLQTFTSGLGEWFRRCQTYEGGMGGAPDNEAHGAYAFCSLACLCIMDAPHQSIPKYLNVQRLISWLSSRQYAPEGSLSGRTSKLVDACYSHWVGGCFALIEAAISPNSSQGINGTHLPPNLWDRQALIRYTLCCSQSKTGGLRDKPGTRPDGYHTCYSLAGLSTAQTYWVYHDESSAGQLGPGAAPFNWNPRAASGEEMKDLGFDKQDAVAFVHPVFVVPPHVIETTRKQFGGVTGF